MEVALIGNGLMRSEIFGSAILQACGASARRRHMDLPWPDDSMTQEKSEPRLEKSREYFGSTEVVASHAAGAAVLATRLAPVSAVALDSFPAMKMVVAPRENPVIADLAAAAIREDGVVCAPGRNASAGEFSIESILALTRSIAAGLGGLRRGGFRGDPCHCEFASEKFANKPVGVIGFGIIGKMSVTLLQVFDRRIIACDPNSGLLTIDAKNHCVDSGEFDELLEHSGTATLRARVGPDTEGMIRANEFAIMTPGAFFVNTARDALVDKDSPHGAFAEHRLSRARLDTFDVEPSPRDMSFLRLPEYSFDAEHCASIEKDR